jgi:hypothetical protein
MNFRKILAVNISVVLVIIGPNVPAHAAQQQWGASYLDWSGASLSVDSTISQIIQPRLALGQRARWGIWWDSIQGNFG